MTQWRHMLLWVDTSRARDITDDLNREGARGWELVCVVPTPERQHATAIFKRPVELPGEEQKP